MDTWLQSFSNKFRPHFWPLLFFLFHFAYFFFWVAFTKFSEVSKAFEVILLSACDGYNNIKHTIHTSECDYLEITIWEFGLS